mmetsp:Transcript_92947/g.165287  ORF Transcript_92947/g.165287 Transcript_92947/m.165287 type:complete len:413 (+) Transcript_92947:56-1294(+)|eukprot:CAMPEP_0197624452 /NCGR_PEP_ID=MMETSP1338-20131121/4081_1 /TAXON_ID=43686 ORGANISM="Pelagodinium beii, Strain RCC1491" /NCGR_SAMPLE_ID=MMETSP1338 /ASSEMBLY_ACC=CAM_ASM_000754 /LENGTH=412 /DNA_ID=CAMNT_0043194589 /DNA_START=32 /DNA_END=1270 /DNA_ORIENTATION=+
MSDTLFSSHGKLSESGPRDPAALEKDLSLCCQQIEALRACLVDAQVLRQSAFLAKLHKVQFDTVWKTYKFTSDSGLQDILQIEGAAVSLGVHLGRAALTHVAAASKQTCNQVSNLWPVVKDLNRIYVCGGSCDSRHSAGSTLCFDPETPSWKDLPRMSDRRAYASAGVAGDRLYVFGGSSNGLNGLPLSTGKCLNITSGEWETMPPMSLARKNAAASFLGGKLYVCGGMGEDSQPLGSVERYDPSVSIWESLPSMTTLRDGPAVTGTPWDELYVCGGHNGTTAMTSVERFQPVANRWQPAVSMLEARFSAAAAFLQNRIFVCGGVSDGMQHLRSVESLSFDAGFWETVEPMTTGRCLFSAVVVERCIFVLGGFSGDEYLNSVECYDPTSGSWTQRPPMPERCEGAAVAAGLA